MDSINDEPVHRMGIQVPELHTGQEQSLGSAQNSTNGHTILPMDLDEERPATSDNITYPTGLKVWLAMAAIYTAHFLNGLDLTIVAVAVPSLTDYFGKVNDIGWYSAAYGMTASAFKPFFGKACTVFSPKSVVLTGLTIFLLGSVICTFASQSSIFIFGRALAGLGCSAYSGAGLTLVTHLFPQHKRSLWLGMTGAVQSIGLSCAPVVGGVLIDAFSWRACFGINLPLCPLAIALTFFFVNDPIPMPETHISFRKKFGKLDLFGAAILIPCVTCLLIGLQWGGIRYGWGNFRIIMLLVITVTLAVVFGYMQHKLGEKATVPLRIAKRRSTIACMWFTVCCSGSLAITEYYTSIYWQGIRGETPTTAGLLGLSMILGLGIGCTVSGFGINLVGYYTPFMLATSIMAPIASGLLTTLDLDESKVKVVALLGLLGFGIGLGLNAPIQAMAAILSPQEVSLGIALVGFSSGLASALFISGSATLFQTRLVAEISGAAPGTNTTSLSHAGLSDIRNLIGPEHLRDVLTGYNRATVETLYMPLALMISSIIGSSAMEWVSVKKKRD